MTDQTECPIMLSKKEVSVWLGLKQATLQDLYDTGFFSDCQKVGSMLIFSKPELVNSLSAILDEQALRVADGTEGVEEAFVGGGR